MMLKGLIFICFWLGNLVSIAQQGHYFMANHDPSVYGFDNMNFDMIQDNHGIIHVANRQGLLNFDGQNWKLIETPYSLFCLVYDSAKNLYAGGREGFGRFIPNDSSGWVFSPIDTVHRDLSKAVVHNNQIYFINDNQIIRYNIQERSVEEIKASGFGDLLDVEEIDQSLFFTTSNLGLRELVGDSLVQPTTYVPENAYFVRASPSDNRVYLTDQGQLLLDNDTSFQKVSIRDSTWLSTHMITQVEWVSDSLVALGSLSGGVMFINPFIEKENQIIDYSSGLPDNEVLAIYVDQWRGVWIVHPLGLTVVYPDHPFRSFAHYPGLAGTLLSSIIIGNTLYIATSVGVYRLITIERYVEKVSYELLSGTVSTSSEPNRPPSRKRKGLFSFLRKKKNKNPENLNKESGVKQVKKRYKKRVEKQIASVRYSYERIKGINAKAVQLAVFDDKLVAGTRQGLYLIKEDSAIRVAEVPVQFVYYYKPERKFFVSTVNEEVKVYIPQGTRWKETGLLDGLKDYIDQILPDNRHNLWLCGADSVYRITLDRGQLEDVEVYEISNPHFERLYATILDDQILFINSSGYYTYRDRSIQKVDSLDKVIGRAHQFILGAYNRLWINVEDRWMGGQGDLRQAMPFMNLIDNPKSLSIDSSGRFWIITADNELYRISPEDLNSLDQHHGVFLKEIRGSSGRLSIRSSMHIQQVNSSLTFEFVSPDYSGINQMEYKYRLSAAHGSSSPWSEWSETNNIISFPFLPPGNYQLEAESRNKLGTVDKAIPFTFQVVAPYWKRPWFYMLELVFFGSLLALSFYLNRGKGRYSFMSRLLGFLTLILVVEFFQTIAEYKFGTNSSPVINFFIQAFIALLILPVESLLRRLITGPESKSEGKLKNS